MSTKTLIFYGLILYVVLYIFRPADLFPVLVPLRLALVVSLFTLILIILTGRFSLPKDYISFFILLFFLINLISLFITPYTSAADSIFPHLYKTLILFFMVTMVIDSEKVLKRFVEFLILFTFIDGVWSVLSFMWGNMGYRLGSFFGGLGADPNEYGMHLLMVLPFSIILLQHEEKYYKKGLYIFSSLIFIYCIVRTYSRGTSIASFVVLLLLILNQRKSKYFWVVFLILLFSFIRLTPDGFWERISTITISADDADGSISSRMLVLQDGLALVSNNPFTGVGIGAFRYAREKVAAFSMDTTHWVAHNSYLEIGAETGLPSLIIFLSIIISSYLNNKRLERNFEKFRVNSFFIGLSQAMRISLIGFSISAFFLSVRYERIIYILLALMLSLKKIYIMNCPPKVGPSLR